MIHRTPFFLPLLYPKHLEWRVRTSSKDLFLTFDDGPVPGPTEFVLETLQRFGAGATFFCIGDNILKHPDVYQRISSDGHRSGNHTFNHLNGWRTRDEEYVENTARCQQIIDASVTETATVPALFRPPYGRIKRTQISSLKEFRIIMWDVLTRDYDAGLPPERCLRKSIAVTRPGSIIVFHDSYKAERNLRYVLPRYLETFAAKGYSFKVL
jgi:peptidoglycan/xylan/chitin deacetylase (PgdA/CDA1 family)